GERAVDAVEADALAEQVGKVELQAPQQVGEIEHADDLERAAGGTRCLQETPVAEVDGDLAVELAQADFIGRPAPGDRRIDEAAARADGSLETPAFEHTGDVADC